MAGMEMKKTPLYSYLMESTLLLFGLWIRIDELVILTCADFSLNY